MIAKKYKMEKESKLGGAMPSYQHELGNRLEVIANRLGQEDSVKITEKSWKQLQRYFKGAETPVGVVRAIALMSKVSLAYLIDGIIQVSEDAEIERLIIDQKLNEVRSCIESTTNLDELSELRGLETHLLERSQFFYKVCVALLDKRKYPSSYEEYFEPKFIRMRSEIDPQIIKELQEGAGIEPSDGMIDPERWERAEKLLLGELKAQRVHPTPENMIKGLHMTYFHLDKLEAQKDQEEALDLVAKIIA